ncbi:Rieske 2Fe-2S domain-containing protein [Comamonas testosteroni]|uniref:Rieske 2Fe-2S domain-containing protein n=1 Tax=Comamonas testosteroni TaxID=285 RepID=UPI00389AD84F
MPAFPAVVERPLLPGSQLKTNYPRNCWWVAATRVEVTREPLGRVILGRPIVMYRKEDGSIAVLEDRCVHRWAPLSIGKVVGDNIVCGYHGFTYGADGNCNHIPTQSVIPPKAKVHSYPVRERGPFVWVYTGDVNRIDEVAPPPALEWVDDPAWIVASGTYDLKANYMALKENVLDLTHFAFVHPTTFSIMDFLRPPDVAVDGDRVSYEIAFRDTPLPSIYGDSTGIGSEKNATRLFRGAFVSPGIQEATVEIIDSAPAPGGRGSYNVKVMHLTTPVSMSQTYYWWIRAQDFGHRPGLREELQATVESAFDEDKVVLEATQRIIDVDLRHRDVPEVSIRADEAGVRIRRVVSQMMQREALIDNDPH